MVINYSFWNQNKKNFLFGLFFIAFIYFFYLIVFTSKTEPLWNFFPDSNDYITQSKSSLLSIEFYAPKPRMWFSPRPFTVPLFLKMIGSDPYDMVLFQRIFYCGCVLILILSISSFVLNIYLKFFFQILLLYFFTWWDIVGWSNSVVSESVSTSLMFLWFATILYYLKKPQILSLLCLILVSFLLSFTRDTWPYIILIFAISNFVVFKLIKKSILKLNVVFLFFSITLFIIQNITSNIGERYKLPVFNSIVGRVSQTPDYLEWFKKEGMPMADQIVKDFNGVDVDSQTGRPIIYQKYNDSLYIALFDWVKLEGKSKYQKFILTHPGYFFFTDQTKEQIQRIFCTNPYKQGYFQVPDGFFMNADHVLPFFNLWSCVFLMGLMIVLFIRNKKVVYLFPLLLFALFACNIMLSYNADTMEVNRHLLTSQIILEFICILSFIFLCDYFLNSIKKRKLKEV